MRYPASEKLEIIRLVEQSHLPAGRTLEKLGILLSRPMISPIGPGGKPLGIGARDECLGRSVINLSAEQRREAQIFKRFFTSPAFSDEWGQKNQAIRVGYAKCPHCPHCHR
jgi:hypothetical protein